MSNAVTRLCDDLVDEIKQINTNTTWRQKILAAVGASLIGFGFSNFSDS